MSQQKMMFLLSFVLALSLHGADLGTSMEKYTPGQWSFSSDHLPGAGEMQIGEDILYIAFFNALNENYKVWITKGQQLGESDLYYLTEEERNKANAKIIDHEQVSIWALQECAPKFIAKLKKKLNPKYRFAQVTKALDKDYGLVVYDGNKLKLLSETVVPYMKNGKEENYMQILKFRHIASGEEFTFINTHAAFGVTHQLRDYLLTLSGRIIAAGDMNVGFHDPRDESNFQKELWEGLEPQGFGHIKFPYTHVNTLAVLDTFDHIIYKDIKVSAAEKLTSELRKGFSLQNRR
jgi:hypothetical protein